MKKLLSLFNLRSIEADVYQALFYGGQMGASQLAKSANISRTSVYDILERLIEIGLVSETMKSGVKMFNVQPPEKIKLLIKEKEREVSSAIKTLDNIKKEYLNQHKGMKPRLQVFEGRSALQQMMKDMLLYKDTTVEVYWPIKKMISLLTPSFFEKFHKERVERNINIRAIWPVKQTPSMKNYSFLKVEPRLKREVKLAPPNVDFSLGYAIYGNTVRFISSSKENFGFLVESQELAEMMSSQFKIIWNISKPVK
ncbi:hypothetical protein KKG41_06225 [Patescibacteria group bacterium]|nr:hypothetical protein [Patescibacteria group bacterium]MBU1891080.1 hypothetical protein [Patescibacteria group bacterium]